MRKRRADQTPPESPPTPPAQAPEQKSPQLEVLQITTLDQLQSACARLLHVQFLLPKPDGGATIALIPVRLLRPNESEQLELILKEAHPPMKEVVQPNGSKRMEYMTDEKTIAKAAHLRKVARAIALWWACPLFQDSEEGKQIKEKLTKPANDVSSRDIVYDFVQSKFTEKILNDLYSMARAEEFQLEERVNFTTPPA